jgi:hypothetical protein
MGLVIYLAEECGIRSEEEVGKEKGLQDTNAALIPRKNHQLIFTLCLYSMFDVFGASKAKWRMVMVTGPYYSSPS